jgi:hypothetical protein
MNFLKKLPWITILVAVVAAFKYRDEIMGFLEDKAPSVANFVKPTSEQV